MNETIEVKQSLADKINDRILGPHGEGGGAFGWGAASTIAAALGSTLEQSVLAAGIPGGLIGHFLFGKRFLVEKETSHSVKPDKVITHESFDGLVRSKLYGEKGGHSLSAGFGVGAVIGGSVFGPLGVLVGGVGAGLANGLLHYKGLKGKVKKVN